VATVNTTAAMARQTVAASERTMDRFLIGLGESETIDFALPKAISERRAKSLSVPRNNSVLGKTVSTRHKTALGCDAPRRERGAFSPYLRTTFRKYWELGHQGSEPF
jgi:hypothetical protein